MRTIVGRIAASGSVALTGLLAIAASPAALPTVLPASGYQPVKVERRLKAPPGRADALREDALARARVWAPPERPIRHADLSVTSTGSNKGHLADEVACKFHPQEESGNMPKFHCVFENGEVLKVKYGNPEVHTEVAAARLLHALGFGADQMYLLSTLRCFGCPEDPFPVLQCAFSPLEEVQRNCPQLEKGPRGALVLEVDYSQYVDFTNVSVERRAPGKVIQGSSNEGWGWQELDAAQSAGRGAPREQRDALRLMAVFLNNWDNKPSNQRLLCLPGGAPPGKSGRCSLPFAYMNDLGASFGGSGSDSDRKLNVESWSAVPIWEEPGTCRVSIRYPHPVLKARLKTLLRRSSFGEVDISEAGRRFVADRLRRLSDRQIHDLFAGGRFTEYPAASDASRDVESWVRAFKQKTREIADRPPCPAL